MQKSVAVLTQTSCVDGGSMASLTSVFSNLARTFLQSSSTTSATPFVNLFLCLLPQPDYN